MIEALKSLNYDMDRVHYRNIYSKTKRCSITEKKRFSAHMKLNQRYVKVFALYFVSIVTANIIVKNNNLIKTLIQTIAGYTVFLQLV